VSRFLFAVCDVKTVFVGHSARAYLGFVLTARAASPDR